MKIEIGESLLLSWLKHVKECRLVQLNWKPSSKWDLRDRETLEQLMASSKAFFAEKYGYDLYKETKSIDQLLTQAEIDVMGMSYDNGAPHVYGIDVAFHEGGLNYGSKAETIARVVKKILRAAMCLHGYMGVGVGTIVFASPRINPAIHMELMRCVGDAEQILLESGLQYQVRILYNENFREAILEPVLSILDEVADTSELFMRSLQMYNLFAAKGSKQGAVPGRPVLRRAAPQLDNIEADGLSGLKEMKIGVIVKTILRRLLEEGKVSEDEIGRMQSKSYSKETFDIQYPLLQKASITQGKRPPRYYSAPVQIYGEEFFLCSEWYETPVNNDRPYLMKWLGLYM